MFARFSVKKPYTVLVAVVLVIVLGVVSFTRMTTDLLPDMSLPYVIVVTTDMGASPEEVEKDVTAPIEAAMATTSNIKNITSTSSDNYSMVMLEYEQETNMDSIIIEIQQSLDQLAGSWADTVGTPMIMQVDPDMMPVLIASADMEGMDQSELSIYVTDKLVPLIESIEGVAAVSATGVLDEDIQVTLDQKKIDKLNEEIQEKIAEQFAEAQAELDEAAEQISDGKEKLEDGMDELSDKVSSADNEINNQQLELVKNEAQLESSLMSLTQTKGILEKVIPMMQNLYNDYVTSQQQFEELCQQMAAQQQAGAGSVAGGTTDGSVVISGDDLSQLEQIIEADTPVENPGAPVMSEEQIAQLQQQAGVPQEVPEELKLLLESLGMQLQSFEQIPNLLSELSGMLIEVNTGITTINTAKVQIADGKTALSDASLQLQETLITSVLEMSKGYADLAVAASQVEMGQAQLDSAQAEAESAADLNAILTADTLGNLLLAQNFSMPVGYVGTEDEQYLVRVGDEIADMEELKNTVLIDLGFDGIEPIKVSDIATIEMIDDAADSYSKVNGNPAIMLSIEKQTGYSTGDVTDRVLERFEELEEEEEGLRLAVMMDQGIYIDMVVNSVIQNMLLGAALAVIVLILFLKDIRPTLVIACSIPLSVIFAIVLMYFTDISLNMISLSGLALGVGMLVDNSIVVIENIYRFRNEGYSVRKAAVEGAGQVTGAIVGSTLTTVCVFAPIIFTEGITRQLFVDIALTIAFTLTASLIVAMTFVPMMSSVTLKKTKEIKHGFMDKVVEVYGKMLHVALRWKPLIFVLSIALLIGSMMLAFSRGFTFIDMEMETDQISVSVGAKEDQILDEEELKAYGDEVMERIMTIEGIDSVGAMMGGNSMSMLGGSSNAVTMYIILNEEAEVSNSEIQEQIVSLTSDLDCAVTVENSMSDMTALLGSGISVQIKGNSLEKLQEIAAEVAAIVEETEGTVDVNDGLDNSTASFTISVDKEKAASYGMTVAQVFQLVYAEMSDSTSPTTLSTDLNDYDVYVQSEDQSDVTLDDIKAITFTYADKITGEEEEIGLDEIAEFVEGISLNSINRDAQTRYISVTAAIDEEHNVTLVSNEIQKKLANYDVPAGYEIDMTGEDEMINESMNQMYLMLLLAVIFIYLIMVAQFQSLLSPFIIMFTIPLAFTGGFFALYFTGYEVSIIAMIGFVMLAGIIVNNGIVLVDYINQLRREGQDKKEAIVEAGKTRMRPVLMTALTTILAMITMALGIGEGSEMMQPMAIVEVGGLVYGTLLTLFVVPCIYDAFHRNKSMVEEEL